MNSFMVQSVYGDIEVFENDLITAEIQKFGGHTRPEFAFALSVLNPSMSVFDLGAHVGTFSLAALAKMHTDKLVALEGNTATHEVLTRNLAGKGTAICALVGASDGLAFFDKAGNSGGSRLMKNPDGGFLPSERASHALTSIDRLAAENFVPDYIKLDVEGAEYAALDGSEIVAKHTPILYLEVSEGGLRGHGNSRRQLGDMLRNLGYRFFVNTFDRNGSHDLYRAREISRLTWRWEFDALCIHKDAEICEAMRRSTRAFRPRDIVRNTGRDVRRRLRRFRK